MKETNQTLEKIKERRKRGNQKDLYIALSYLLLPAMMVSLLVLLIPYSFILSLIPVYFILPMFYTVEKRIRYVLTGIGKKDFSYKDGYIAFFREKKGGVFGVIMSLLIAFSFLLLTNLIFSNFVPNLFTIFPESNDVFNHLKEILIPNQNNTAEILQYLSENIAALYRPLSIYVSLIFFIPILSIFFLSIPNNLTSHYLATIVLPDIDNNVSAAQARSLAKYTLIRPINSQRRGYQLRYNWPYLLAFTILYGLSTYVFSIPTIAMNALVPIVVLITPALSVFYAVFLSYACIYNDYAIIEEMAPSILPLLPESIRVSIYQAYNNPHYIHGEESAMRGGFVPNPNSYNTFYASANDMSQNPDENIDISAKEPEPQNHDEAPNSAIFDFSAKDIKQDEEEREEK